MSGLTQVTTALPGNIAVEFEAFLVCIVFRARPNPHLDNRIARKRRFKKGQLRVFRKEGLGESRKDGSPEGRNNWSQDRATKKSSYKEHRVDALAPYAEEGRGKLRKATGSGKQA